MSKYVKKTVSYTASLAFTHPNIAAQWHPTKNGNKKATDFKTASGKKIWWVCENNHEYETTIDKRTSRGDGCPYCSGRRVLTGFNDLKTKHPDIAKIWHPTRNSRLTSQNVSPKSNKKIWWVCGKGHEWERTVAKQLPQQDKCPYCNGRKILPGFNDLATTNPKIVEEWHPTRNNNMFPENFTKGADVKVWWKCEKEHEWQSYIYSRTANHHCPECFNTNGVSSIEKQLQSYLLSIINPSTLQFNVRNILNGKELDVYVPGKNIAIEFNGLYWHSEATGKTKTYHYDKWLACKNQGIQLIQVWEDDWRDRKLIVEKMLANKLQVPGQEKVFARKTIIKPVNSADSHIFLEQNHIQGYVPGSIRVGLYNSDNLVALMILKKEPTTQGTQLNLLRYATSVSVPGGFTKLLTHVEKTYNPTKIITFSDNSISDGNLYRTNGFVNIKEIPPDYTYLVNRARKHKFNYRINRFKTDLMLEYEVGLTESELAALNNLYRVWDSGKIKWERKNV